MFFVILARLVGLVRVVVRIDRDGGDGASPHVPHVVHVVHVAVDVRRLCGPRRCRPGGAGFSVFFAV